MGAPAAMRNRLATASSPYLRMHAGNPVAWQPWDAIALQQARASDTPILLSIGYSACHWCHVMAHECFENADIAAAMNRGFVNIKLDREERPDIDRVYQLAHQALSGRGGGWPLTAFLDPQDLSPFYIGTYFPPEPRHGLPDFPAVLQRVRAYFDGHRDEIRSHAAPLRDWLQHAQAGGGEGAFDADAADATGLRNIAARFDAAWGGSRGAPKFPHAAEIEWLLDRPAAGHGPAMAHRTLQVMAERGLQDHLGGGFFRYCIDADWTIPHFEKMLYDNAQLLPAYARVATATGADAALRATATAAAQGIVDWLARDMTAPGGAFCSALDADSEHAEGKFYLWTREQVEASLPPNLGKIAAAAFGLDAPPNFEGRAWHLLRATPLADIARDHGEPLAAISAGCEEARRRLCMVRQRRVAPARDDKVLTAWNALAISGLARAARLLGDARCAKLARRALDALRDTAWIDGELYANAAEPAARIPGFLDDHAFLLDALLEMLQLAFDPRELRWATALADALRAKFGERGSGGFWFSHAQHATPLARSRDWTDDALPNGNGVAVRALLRLGHLTGNTDYLGSAEHALRAASGALRQYPDACPTLLRALDEFARPRTQVVVRCTAAQVPEWRAAVRDGLRALDGVRGADAADAFIIPGDAGAVPGLLAARTPRGDAGTAYVCTGLTCGAPVTASGALAAALRSGTPAA